MIREYKTTWINGPIKHGKLTNIIQIGIVGKTDRVEFTLSETPSDVEIDNLTRFLNTLEIERVNNLSTIHSYRDTFRTFSVTIIQMLDMMTKEQLQQIKQKVEMSKMDRLIEAGYADSLLDSIKDRLGRLE